MSKSTWFSDYDYRDYSYSTGSGSRSWMSKLSSSSSSWWRRDEKDANSTLQDLLNQLQNSANIIGNDSTCRVSVRWSNGANVNGSKESDGTHRIYLSPDNLVSGEEVSEEVLDAMTGKVYLASTLRETVHQQSYNAAANYRRFNNPETKNSVGLWESLETSIARSKILEDWAGFAPYVAGDAKRSSSSKDATQNFIDSSIVSPNLDAVTTAIAWNLLNPKDQVGIPACYDKCVKAASEMMEQEVSADKRFESCANIVSKMNEILKQMEEEKQEQDQDQDQDSKGGGGEGGEGDSDDDGDEESKPKPSEEKGESGEDSPSEGKSKKKGEPSKPSLCDSSLLGEAVKNKTDSELSKQEAEDASKSDEDKSEIRAKAPVGMCDLGKKHRVKQESCEGMEGDYKEIVSSHRKEISAIRSSLMFRKTQPKMVSYGHRSGDIDENSLFKIRMNDDRVMTKTDSIDTKKIAICLLIDESGSMGHHEGGKTYAAQARDVAIVLAESLRGMDGMEVCIYGHTAEDGFRGVTLREYYSPRQRNLAALMNVSARMENHDSYAILHTANLFNRDCRDCDRKIMFVISDGEPAGSGYGGGPAYKHMLEVNRACMGKGVEVYGVGIANAFSQELGEKMYGENKCIILSDVRSSLGVMSRFIRQIAIKQGVR